MVIKMNKALTIAGSDSGGGAGIEADLKTFAAFGVHGMVAITSVTAQNTLSVEGIHDLPAEMVKKQIECVAEDIGVDAAKTGMLSNSSIIKAVSSTIQKYDFPVVVDPVMIAKSGAYLLKEDAIDAFIEHIVPLATVITPNRHEAERLSGIKIRSREDARKAARKIEKLGAGAVIVKGGHIGRDATDLLYYRKKFYEFKGRRIKDGCTHGTGCSFSAAIAANLAKGYDIVKATEIAKKFITMAIEYGIKVGHGHCPVNPTAWVGKDAERWRVYKELEEMLQQLIEMDIVDYIPEVGMNIAYALPEWYLKSEEDVAAVEGRIVRAGRRAMAGKVKFGASRHLARALLKVMEFDGAIRAVMNIRFDEKILVRAKKIFSVSFYDREEEPEEVKRKEGATIPWGIEQAIKRAGGVPDVIYHRGDVGKEPMILIFARDMNELLQKFKKLKK